MVELFILRYEADLHRIKVIRSDICDLKYNDDTVVYKFGSNQDQLYINIEDFYQHAICIQANDNDEDSQIEYETKQICSVQMDEDTINNSTDVDVEEMKNSKDLDTSDCDVVENSDTCITLQNNCEVSFDHSLIEIHVLDNSIEYIDQGKWNFSTSMLNQNSLPTQINRSVNDVQISEEYQDLEDSVDDFDEDDCKRWTDSNTICLLKLWKGMVKNYKTKTQKFIAIGKVLKKKGYNFEPTQISNRLSTLKRAYKNNLRLSKSGHRVNKMNPKIKQMLDEFYLNKDSFFWNMNSVSDDEDEKLTIEYDLNDTSKTLHIQEIENIKTTPASYSRSKKDYSTSVSKKNNISMQKLELMRTWRRENNQYKESLLKEMSRTNDIFNNSIKTNAELLEKILKK